MSDLADPKRPAPPYSSVTLSAAEAAYEGWGANCGPGALAGATAMSLDEVRHHLEGFDDKRYTNPSMMYAALRSMGIRWTPASDWPDLGLVRVQWEGPWTKPGVPIKARYRHTHWVASQRTDLEHWVFDINAVCVGGWIPYTEWAEQLVPWLIRECVPRADGRWHTTHRLRLHMDLPRG